MSLEPTNKWVLTGRYWVRKSDGRRIPVIQGGGKSNTIQNDIYAFGDDDGNEAGHTLDTENTDRTAQIADVTFMIRMSVEENASGTMNLESFLFARKNGTGIFDPVTTTSINGIIIANDTQSRTDDEDTTERLTAGAGTWQAGKYDDGQIQAGCTAVGMTSEYADFEFAVQIDSTYAAHLDDFEFRIEHTAAGSDLDSYPGTYPTVTANIPTTGQPTQIRTQGVPTGSGSKDRPGKYNIWRQKNLLLEMFTRYITNARAFSLVN